MLYAKCYMLYYTLIFGDIKIDVPFVDYYESLASIEAILFRRQNYF